MVVEDVEESRRRTSTHGGRRPRCRRQVLDAAIGAAITSGFAQAPVFSLSYRGLLAMASEDHEQALSDLERAVELSEAGRFKFCEAQARSMAGIAEVLRGQPEAAAVQLGIAEDIARDTWAWPWTQAVLGQAALARLRDDLGEASRLALIDVFASDDQVVALIHETASRAGDGTPLDVREAHVLRLDADRKVTDVWDLPDDPAAHDAFFS